MKRLALYLLLFSSCTLPQNGEDQVTSFALLAGDASLRSEKGSWLYNNKPLTGSITVNYPSGKIHQVTNYLLGREHGWQKSYHENGVLSETRYYTNGEKDNVH